MRVLLMILLIAAALLLATFAADAQQQPCAPLKDVQKELSGKYGEHPAWVGIDNRGPVMMTMNPTTGTWSIIVLRNGLACFLGAGDRGQLVDLPKPGEPT